MTADDKKSTPRPDGSAQRMPGPLQGSPLSAPRMATPLPNPWAREGEKIGVARSSALPPPTIGASSAFSASPSLSTPNGGPDHAAPLDPSPPSGFGDWPSPGAVLVESRRRWPRSAKLTAGALALSTVGLGGWAADERSTIATKSDTVADLTDDLGRSRTDVERLEGRLADTEQSARDTAADAARKIASVQADLSTASADRDAARAQAEAYAGLFPIDLNTVAGADPTGSYSLAVTPAVDACTGYADPTTACSVDTFPADLSVAGDATAGYVAASTWFDPIALTFDGSVFRGTGQLKVGFGNLCDGVEVATTVVVAAGPYSVAPTGGPTPMKAVVLTGRIDISTAEAATCLASSRRADVVAELT